DGSSGWRGVVLVIGQGVINAVGRGGNQFGGAIFVAKTLDTSGNVLPSLGIPQVFWSNSNPGNGNAIDTGIYYDTCWINHAWAALAPPYQVLPFREIPE